MGTKGDLCLKILYGNLGLKKVILSFFSIYFLVEWIFPILFSFIGNYFLMVLYTHIFSILLIIVLGNLFEE